MGADVVKAPKTEPKDGKFEVVVPVGFPDEGTFSWLDGFLEKNPQYVELSDRMIHEWIVKSGIWKQKQFGQQGNWNQSQDSNDKPLYNFGLQQVDDQSIRKAIYTIAPLAPRHYILMEVKQNLIAADRKENLKRFNLPHFKKIATVVMGEPPADHKVKVHAQFLK